MDAVKAMSKLEDILKNLGIPEELIQPDALLHRDLQLDSTEKIEISCQAIYGNMMRTGDNYKCFLSTAHTDEDIDRLIRAVKNSIEKLREAGFLSHLLVGTW